jgi:outer membrane protein insertion porin family
LFDTRISAGFEVYKTERDYSKYDKDSEGGRIKFGFPVVTDTRLYWSYTYDVSDIFNIEEDAATSIFEMQGSSVTSSTQLTLRYDTRDKIINASEGTNSHVAVEYAGLGGDIAFTKYTTGSSWYFPIFFGTVGMINGRAGYVHDHGWGLLPDYERFYLGGMYTVRGFGYRDIHAEDEDGDEIGGNSYIQMNLEWSIPLIAEAGMVWVFFVDAGGVFGEEEDMVLEDIREGGGAGIRWYSPLGPIRLEYGWILDPIENESTQGRWEFAIGTLF